ncbi:hypothetical protein LSM04_006211 [Trypanosoma melophagium]|uniref:uncharacterized protein n=1 Tax=Trypanosoma melophagium TaxID=715481 RepID=UPI00351A9AC8|nr:hypothetical protein LSM04_006211 [Trypanosoma melophagium]
MAQRRSAILAQCRSLGPAVFANRTPTHERRKQHNRAQINPAKATKQPPETHQKDQFGPALRLEPCAPEVCQPTTEGEAENAGPATARKHPGPGASVFFFAAVVAVPPVASAVCFGAWGEVGGPSLLGAAGGGETKQRHLRLQARFGKSCISG